MELVGSKVEMLLEMVLMQIFNLAVAAVALAEQAQMELQPAVAQVD
jgi:hypothetical protein